MLTAIDCDDTVSNRLEPASNTFWRSTERGLTVGTLATPTYPQNYPKQLPTEVHKHRLPPIPARWTRRIQAGDQRAKSKERRPQTIVTSQQ
jgi:hypothetical protein